MPSDLIYASPAASEGAIIPATDRQYPFELSIVIPTRNERDNVEPLLMALHDALAGIGTEIIFVDDSDDATPARILDAALQMSANDFSIQLEHRPQGPARSGGLATAVELGMRAAQAPYVAVIDADLQHPPQSLRALYEEAVRQTADVAIGTRYRNGGTVAGLDGISRRFFSMGLKWTAKTLFPDQLLRVSDPLSGFFLIRTSMLDDVILRPIGYKISLEVLLRCAWTKLIEVPYAFQKRQHGQSKSDFQQGVNALKHMLRLLVEVPAAGRFWKFCAVGAFGVLVNLMLFALLTHAHQPLWLSWLGATEGSLLGNFLLNDRFTWRGTSNAAIWQRLARYHLTMLGSITVSLAIFAFAFAHLHQWLLAQLLALLGSTFTSYWLAKRWVFTTEELALRDVGPILAQHWERGKQWVAPIFLAVAAVVISTSEMGGWIVLAAFLLGASIVYSQGIAWRQAITMLLAVVTGVAAIDYLTWRVTVTNWGNWWIAVPLLAAEAFGIIHTVGFQVTIWPWEPPHLHPSEDPTQRPIYIFIPTVDEGLDVLRPTVQGALVARETYLRANPDGHVAIVICNDGRVAKAANWQQPVQLAARMGVTCITREVGGGAKAGNIENARQQVGATDDALLVIFDADQVAKPDFLLKMVAPFVDASVGWVQSGQYYGNRENPVSHWAHDQQALFYRLLCPGKAAQNAAFICGTNVMLRASALDAIGGLPQDSVTEDFAASIALHPTWRSVFLNEELATGLGPMDLPAYLKQQRRWAIGTMGVLRTHWREIFLPRRHGLSLPQRFQYFLACTHYLSGLRDSIYIIAPLMFLLTGIPAVRGSTLNLFLWHFLPYWLASMATFWFVGRSITSLRGVIMGFGSFPFLIESLLSVVLKRNFSFTVTAKQRNNQRSWRHLQFHIIAFIACLVGLVLALTVKGRQSPSVTISLMWILYTMVMLGGFFWLAYRDTMLRGAPLPRVAWLPAARLRITRAVAAGQSKGFAWKPVAFTAFVLITISGTLWTSNAQAGYKPVVYAVSATSAPRVGLSLPVGLLMTQPSILSSQLQTSFGVIGRTQEIQDDFDVAWAQHLANQHAYPWITLQFGHFGADGRPPLNASLVAIANGMQDGALQRWATAMRAYGQPILLTVLLHVDRNWALSSAVANGGIPSDAARAWLHIQAIFHAVGATNVAWVWSPADPANDQIYAPPVSTINVVLLSMISYPFTQWANPLAKIQAVRQRYPNTPLMIEVSANGLPTDKARWLTEVGAAVRQTPGIYALIYHEGSPAIVETAAGDHAWSLDSDPQSFQVMRSLFQSLTSGPPPATPARNGSGPTLVVSSPQMRLIPLHLFWLWAPPRTPVLQNSVSESHERER